MGKRECFASIEKHIDAAKPSWYLSTINKRQSVQQFSLLHVLYLCINISRTANLLSLYLLDDVAIFISCSEF